MNIPQKISKDDFKNKITKILDSKKYKDLGYSEIITSNYTYDHVEEVQKLNGGIDQTILEYIDYILKRIGYTNFDLLDEIPIYFRKLLEEKNRILIFAYNGTGKTRISSGFKSLGQVSDEETGIKTADTLYYNAFTEDLFHWDNDLEHNAYRRLKINKDSKFFQGIMNFSIEGRIKNFLQKYADFDFIIDYTEWEIIFLRKSTFNDEESVIPNIKISRGEEYIFIWCFFLAIVQLVFDGDESYSWVKYIYIDDPISSLDDNNAIAVATHLGQLLKQNSTIKTIISTHHTLFYNVLYHELKNSEKYFLSTNINKDKYYLKDTTSTPFFHHVALLKDLKKISDSGALYTYHFNVLRNILEKTATFHGFDDFSACIKKDANDIDGVLHTRMVNLLSHGNYSLFEPKEMIEENKEHFKKILENFLEDYKFNEKIIGNVEAQEETL